MNKVRWSPDMRLGLPCVDVAHEAVLQELERLAGTCDRDFAVEFFRLVDRIERDFHEEEAMMEEIDYPGLCAHREQHARLLGALHHVAARVMAGELDIGREAVALLPQWLVMHLGTMDTALALAWEICEAERLTTAAPPAR